MPKGIPKSGGARQSKQETLRRSADKLRAKLAELDAQTEAHDAERQRLIGRIVEAHAGENKAFADELQLVLTGAALSKNERKILGLPPTRGKTPRAAGSQAGMQGPIMASTEEPGPTGPSDLGGG